MTLTRGERLRVLLQIWYVADFVHDFSVAKAIYFTDVINFFLTPLMNILLENNVNIEIV